MNVPTTINRISEGDWFKFLSRGSMLITPALLAAVFFTTQGWLTGILSRQSEALLAANTRIVAVELGLGQVRGDIVGLGARLVAVEADSDTQNRFEDQTLSELRDIRAQLAALAARVAALDATIQALRDRTDGLQRPTQL